jgi:putative oxidoreductase
MRYATLLGRILLALIFVMSGFTLFDARTIAQAASQGVPAAHLALPLFGVLATVGGLLVAIGFAARLGALLLIAFLLPVTVTMHSFWAATDPVARQMQFVHFMKNLSILGGTLVLFAFGAGALSVDASLVRRRVARGRAVSRFWATPTETTT